MRTFQPFSSGKLCGQSNTTATQNLLYDVYNSFCSDQMKRKSKTFAVGSRVFNFPWVNYACKFYNLWFQMIFSDEYSFFKFTILWHMFSGINIKVLKFPIPDDYSWQLDLRRNRQCPTVPCEEHQGKEWKSIMRAYLAWDLDGGIHHDFIGGGWCFLGHNDCVVLESRVHLVVPAK